MSLKKNIIDGWVTTIIGIAAMIISLVLIWQKVFDFVWEGIGGLITGAILLIAPKTIEKIIIEGIKAWGKRGHSDYYDVTTTYDNNQPRETLKDE